MACLGSMTFTALLSPGKPGKIIWGAGSLSSSPPQAMLTLAAENRASAASVMSDPKANPRHRSCTRFIGSAGRVEGLASSGARLSTSSALIRARS